MKRIKLVDEIENPDKCIALKRVPHYAIIEGKPCVLLSGSYANVFYRSIDGLIIKADTMNPTFQVDVVEISEDTYKNMGGKELCTTVTLYDRLVGEYPTVEVGYFNSHRSEFIEKLCAKYGEQNVICIEDFEYNSVSFKKGYRYRLTNSYIYNGINKVSVLDLNEKLFDKYFRVLR